MARRVKRCSTVKHHVAKKHHKKHKKASTGKKHLHVKVEVHHKY